MVARVRGGAAGATVVRRTVVQQLPRGRGRGKAMMAKAAATEPPPGEASISEPRKRSRPGSVRGHRSEDIRSRGGSDGPGGTGPVRMLPDRVRETAVAPRAVLPAGGRGPNSITGRSGRRPCGPPAPVRAVRSWEPPGPRRAAIPADRPRGPFGLPAIHRAEARRRRRVVRLPRPLRTEAAGRVRHRGSVRRSVRSPRRRAPDPGPADRSRCSGRGRPRSGWPR